MDNKKGILFVLSGPSGVGKSTIRKDIIDSDPNIWFSISMTTRSPRVGEIDGIDYFFVSKDEFINNINNNNFFEYAEVYTNTFYGTLKSKVLDKLNEGFDVILEIDVEGALNIKKEYDSAILIFVTPPSIDNLEKRLKQRMTDSDEVIRERVNKASLELSFKDKYDYVVVNDNLKEAISEVNKIISLERKK